MIRVLFTFLLSIQYDSLLVVCMIHSNARQVVLLDVSSSVFMVDLKVNPNYKFWCGLWKWFHTSVLRGIAHLEYGAWVYWMASSHWDELLEETDSIWIWIRVYQLFELTIEQKTHDNYTCSSGIENQHEKLTQIFIFTNLHILWRFTSQKMQYIDEIWCPLSLPKEIDAFWYPSHPLVSKSDTLGA